MIDSLLFWKGLSLTIPFVYRPRTVSNMARNYGASKPTFCFTLTCAIKTVHMHYMCLFFFKENMILLMYWDELWRSSCFAHASVKQSWSCDLFLEMCLHDVIRMVQPREKGCQRLHTSFSVLLMWQRDGRSWDKIIKRKTNWEFMDCSAC